LAQGSCGDCRCHRRPARPHMEVQPVANGLRLGTLVQVDGELGQLISYSSADDKFGVVLINGRQLQVSSSSVTVPADLRKPGAGGGESSFDVLMGPRTPAKVLAEEMSACIFEKGFCVLKICQSAKDVQQTVQSVREMAVDGKLGRLPEEVEEGYLGLGGTGKVAWLDDDIDDEILKTNDHNLSYLASLFQPYSADAIGKAIAERSPALISLTLPDEDEDDFPHPAADDKTLGDFLGTWNRALLRVVHFMGPAIANVTLDSKEGPEAAGLPCLQDSITLSAAPNTIVIFRTECYDYTCESDGEVLTLMTSFNSHRPQIVIDDWAGMESLFAGDGPAPPDGGKINIMNISTRLGCCCDEADMYASYLQGATDGVTQIPVTRFDIMAYYEPNPANVLMSPDKSTQKHMAYVDGVDMFDNRYFEISNAEAYGMDPLQRQILEVGGASMGMFGITKKDANRNSHHASVSVGVDKADYPTLQDVPQGGMNVMAIIANRFSFIYNLKGPSFVTDTACSASLVATHLAKYLLLDRVYDPLDFHIAMGTHWIGSPGPFIGCSQSQMTSPEGRCFTFNASANGYLRGEGTSGILMQYGDFPKEREAIWRGSMAGQDGRSASLTAPNGPAQEQCISKAMKEAHMTPPESTAWECHGTGTSLGDPIEIGAARKVQIKFHRQSPLQIGTAKANTGHLEGGAAMAGICKCVLSVSRAHSWPTLHCRQLNPHLEAAAFTAYFSIESTPFAAVSGHCQISSFGFGGTNGHAVLWGQDTNKALDVPGQVMKRLANMRPPEVRTYGRNPDDWEFDWLARDAKAGDKYNLIMSADAPDQTSIKVDKVDALGDEDEVYFSIAGNFNGWTADRMMEGEIPGLFTATVEVPSSGSVEFHFLQNDDEKQMIGPSTPMCSKRLVPIVGPKADAHNWVVAGSAGADMQVELLVQRDRKSIMWLQL